LNVECTKANDLNNSTFMYFHHSSSLVARTPFIQNINYCW